MNNQNNQKKYHINSSIVFRKTKEKFGGLSNMASGYPIEINGVKILTSEALYQALRYPFNPDIQMAIIDQNSPMTAKMKSKKYRNLGRNDWENIRVRVMRWCLRIKLINNWNSFGELLESTEDYPIVEFSMKDDFWGAIPSKENDNILVGQNVLGRLLMELREEYRYVNEKKNYYLFSPEIDDFYFNKEIVPDMKISIETQKKSNLQKNKNTPVQLEW